MRQPSGATIDSFLEAASLEDRPLVEEILGHCGPDRSRVVYEHGVEAVIGALGRLIDER
jgi:hypothetical protein